MDHNSSFFSISFDINSSFFVFIVGAETEIVLILFGLFLANINPNFFGFKFLIFITSRYSEFRSNIGKINMHVIKSRLNGAFHA